MVPNGWKDGRVKDIVKSLDAGVSVNSEDDKDLSSEYKILKTSCVSKGTFDGREVKSVKERSEIDRLKEPVLSNSILVSRMNTPALVGANAYIRFAPANTYLPDRLWQVKPKNSKVDMCWLGYWFGSRHARYTMSANATGTSGSMKNITKPDVMSMKVAIPPLPEQQKIAKILSTWDKAIATTEKLIATSQQQKKALMQQLLTGKKRLANPETGKVFEGNWLIQPLKNIGKLQAGKFVKASEISNTKNENPFPCYGGNGLRGFTASYTHDGLYSLIGRQGALCGNITLAEGKFHATEHAVVVTPYQNIDTKWLYYKLIELELNQYATGQAQPGLSVKNLDPIEVLVSPIEEQQKIASVLTSADKEIELLQAKLAHLKDEKKALMQQLLTGKRRVQVN